MNASTQTPAAPAAAKIWYLEWLRIAACLAVVLIHTLCTPTAMYGASELGAGRALGWTEATIVLGRWAVPVFFMITGALLLSSTKSVSITKALGYAKRIAVILLIFGTLYALMELVFTERTFTAGMLLGAFMAMLQEQSWDHLWYLYDLLGIYLLLPLFKAFCDRASQQALQTVLVILFVLTSVVPTINGAFDLDIANLAWFSSSVFYVLLGHYLSTYVEFNGKLGAVALLALAAEIAIVGFNIVACDDYARWAWDHDSCFLALWATGIFLFGKKYLTRPIRNRFALKIAQLSLAIYIVHPIFTNALYKACGWFSAPLPPVLFELATYAIVFACAFGLAYVLKRIPVLRDYL